MIQKQFSRYTVTAPAPIWYSEGADYTFSNSGKTKRGVEWEIFEAIPPQETFQDWSELWAIFFEHDLAPDLEAYKRAVKKAYIDDCGGIADTGPVIAEDAVYSVFLIYCPKSNSNQEEGSITLFYIQHVGSSWVRVYHEFKGDAFDIRDDTSWPMNNTQYQKFLSDLGKINFRSN